MVPALDGAICRLKLDLGRISAEQAHVVAEAAATYGNGIIEITNRSNLQVRGVKTLNDNALIAALLTSGLGPSTEDGDDVRNVMVSPTAGLDRRQILDVGPLAEHILNLLQTEPRYHALSPKFSVLIDGGESIAMVSHPHDIWLSALPEALMDEPWLAFGLGGIIPVLPVHRPAFGTIRAKDAPRLIAAILDLFLEYSRGKSGISRMRQVLAETAQAKFLAGIKQRVDFPIRDDVAVSQWRRAMPETSAHIGASRQRTGDLASVGAVPPLGRLDPDILHALANLAVKANGGELRMTPWRSVMLPNIAVDLTSDIKHELQLLGLATEIEAPIARMIACSGSAGCGSSRADTQADAKNLASLLRGKTGQLEVHLSGCAKSCAAAHVAKATLIAVTPGHYDLFLRAKDGPARFGRLLAADVTIEQAARLLAALPD